MGDTPVIFSKLSSIFLVNLFGCDLLPAKSGKKANSKEKDCRSLEIGLVSVGGNGTAIGCGRHCTWSSSRAVPRRTERTNILSIAAARVSDE